MSLKLCASSLLEENRKSRDLIPCHPNICQEDSPCPFFIHSIQNQTTQSQLIKTNPKPMSPQPLPCDSFLNLQGVDEKGEAKQGMEAYVVVDNEGRRCGEARGREVEEWEGLKGHGYGFGVPWALRGCWNLTRKRVLKLMNLWVEHWKWKISLGSCFEFYVLSWVYGWVVLSDDQIEEEDEFLVKDLGIRFMD